MRFSASRSRWKSKNPTSHRNISLTRLDLPWPRRLKSPLFANDFLSIGIKRQKFEKSEFWPDIQRWRNLKQVLREDHFLHLVSCQGHDGSRCKNNFLILAFSLAEYNARTSLRMIERRAESEGLCHHELKLKLDCCTTSFYDVNLQFFKIINQFSIFPIFSLQFRFFQFVK